MSGIGFACFLPGEQRSATGSEELDGNAAVDPTTAFIVLVAMVTWPIRANHTKKHYLTSIILKYRHIKRSGCRNDTKKGKPKHHNWKESGLGWVMKVQDTRYRLLDFTALHCSEIGMQDLNLPKRTQSSWHYVSQDSQWRTPRKQTILKVRCFFFCRKFCSKESKHRYLIYNIQKWSSLVIFLLFSTREMLPETPK